MSLLTVDPDEMTTTTDSETTETGRPEQSSEQRTGDIALIAAGASVLLAWYQFYLKENHTRGLFIGLWPPTILAFASVLNQRAMLDKLDRLLVGTTSRLETLFERFA